LEWHNGTWKALSLHTPHGLLPRINVGVRYPEFDGSHSTWYHENLIIDNIKIFELPIRFFGPQRRWVEKLENIIRRYALGFGLKRLSFVKCYAGLPVFMEWIQTRALAGHVLESVTFRDCQSRESWLEYWTLKRSDVVPHVKWEQT
jgi:hypothetical protein